MLRLPRVTVRNLPRIASFLIAVVFVLPLFSVNSIFAEGATPVPVDKLSVALNDIVSGLDTPVAIAHANDGSNRLFIVEKQGRIRILQNGALLPQPFLDIASIVNSASNERGLLGLAFHPNFKQNGLFFVYYTAQNGDITISRYHISADANVADPNTAKVLITQPHPRVNHNGGQLVFGPDGFLYAGLGDGGGAGDPDRNGQNPKTILAAIIRLDVDLDDPYGIPADNPYAQNGDGRPEVWAIGLRNPWRFSFDRLTGDLYIADVGQDSYEEVDFLKAGSPGGANFGWNKTEGFHCYSEVSANSTCDQSKFQQPIAEYNHTEGCSITGGYVYRGKSFPAMQGTYFYSDYCTGTLWALQATSDGKWASAKLLPSVGNVSTFGEDDAGEIYLADIGKGTIYQIVQKNS